MIAVSSFKPMVLNDEVSRNQIKAAETWWDSFDYIIYLGDYDDRLAADNVSFYPCSGKPTIRELCEVCAQQPCWTCIVNSDIQIGDGFRRIQPALEARRAHAAVSWRLMFNPDREAPPTGTMVDWGCDWFAARQDVWEKAAAEVPEDFRIGRILWDTWMLGFFASYVWDWLYDITPARMIYHPEHQNRDSTFDPSPELHSNKYVKAARWPLKQITLT